MGAVRVNIALGILPAVILAVNSCFIFSCAHVIPGPVVQAEHCRNTAHNDPTRGDEHQGDCCLKKATGMDNPPLIAQPATLPVLFGPVPSMAISSAPGLNAAPRSLPPPGPTLHKKLSVFLI